MCPRVFEQSLTAVPYHRITDNGNTIVDIHDVAAPAFFWNTNIPGGMSPITRYVRARQLTYPNRDAGHVGVVELIDSTGATALSAPFTVAPSSTSPRSMAQPDGALIVYRQRYLLGVSSDVEVGASARS